MSKSGAIPPACAVDDGQALLRPGDRVLVSVQPRRPRVAAEVLEVRAAGPGHVYVLVRLQDGRELVRNHAACRRSGFQPGR